MSGNSEGVKEPKLYTERQVALQQACREALDASQAAAQAQAFAATELYMEVCVRC